MLVRVFAAWHCEINTVRALKVEGEDPDTPDYLRGDRVSLGRLGQSHGSKRLHLKMCTSAISDCVCVSLGSLTMKPQDRFDLNCFYCWKQ